MKLFWLTLVTAIILLLTACSYFSSGSSLMPTTPTMVTTSTPGLNQHRRATQLPRIRPADFALAYRTELPKSSYAKTFFFSSQSCELRYGLPKEHRIDHCNMSAEELDALYHVAYTIAFDQIAYTIHPQERVCDDSTGKQYIEIVVQSTTYHKDAPDLCHEVTGDVEHYAALANAVTELEQVKLMTKPVHLIIYFQANATEEQINQFLQTFRQQYKGRVYEQPSGRLVEGHQSFTAEFAGQLIEEERQAIVMELQNMPLVHRVLQNRVPAAITTLDE